MNYYSTQITNLIDELRRLPGIGSKSAQRLAFHIFKKLAANVPVHAPVPGSGIPTNKSNATKSPFPAVA